MRITEIFFLTKSTVPLKSELIQEAFERSFASKYRLKICDVKTTEGIDRSDISTSCTSKRLKLLPALVKLEKSNNERNSLLPNTMKAYLNERMEELLEHVKEYRPNARDKNYLTLFYAYESSARGLFKSWDNVVKKSDPLTADFKSSTADNFATLRKNQKILAMTKA